MQNCVEGLAVKVRDFQVTRVGEEVGPLFRISTGTHEQGQALGERAGTR